MRIFVKAKPGVKRAYVKEKTGLFDGQGRAGARRFVVAVAERAAQGNANRAIEKALAQYFAIAPSRVRIVAGHAAREKTVEISEG